MRLSAEIGTRDFTQDPLSSFIIYLNNLFKEDINNFVQELEFHFVQELDFLFIQELEFHL